MGLMYLGVLVAERAPGAAADAPDVAVLVDGPDGRLFEGRVRAATPLEALERAGEAAGFAVARTLDGGSLAAAAGRANGDGGRWTYHVGDEHLPGPEGTHPLAEGDVVRWLWR